MAQFCPKEAPPLVVLIMNCRVTKMLVQNNFLNRLKYYKLNQLTMHC